MDNIKDVRTEATATIAGLKDGSIHHSKGAVIVKALNVFISSAKAQLEHSRLMGKSTEIDFLK